MAKRKQSKNIFKSLRGAIKGVTNTIKAPFNAISKVENVGGKVESKAKTSIKDAIKDVFTFKGSEQLTQIENTVSNVKSAVSDPVGYAETYVKRKLLNALLTGVTTGVSKVVSIFSKSGGETVEKVGQAITKKLTTATKEAPTETEPQEEKQQEQQIKQEQEQQIKQEVETPTAPWMEGIEPKAVEVQEDTEEGEGVETMYNFINKKLNELPTQLLVLEKSGTYRVVSIEGYRNMLISIFKDKTSRNKDAYEGSSASEFIKVYDEFNRDYDSNEGEEVIKINYESLFDWLAF